MSGYQTPAGRVDVKVFLRCSDWDRLTWVRETLQTSLGPFGGFGYKRDTEGHGADEVSTLRVSVGGVAEGGLLMVRRHVAYACRRTQEEYPPIQALIMASWEKDFSEVVLP